MLSGGLREQLEQVEAQTGKRPAQLDAGGDFPPGAEDVWVWFQDLCATRSGAAAIAHHEMLAYFTLYAITPREWEVRALKALDRAWLVYHENRVKANRGKGKQGK